MKKINNFIFLFVSLLIIGCTNLNEAYNEKKGTKNKNVFIDTLIATTLYNHPELQTGISKNRRKTETKSNSISDISSTTTTSSEISNNGNTTHSETNVKGETKTRTRTRTKSISTGIKIKPNFDYYLK